MHRHVKGAGLWNKLLQCSRLVSCLCLTSTTPQGLLQKLFLSCLVALVNIGYTPRTITEEAVPVLSGVSCSHQVHAEDYYRRGCSTLVSKLLLTSNTHQGLLVLQKRLSQSCLEALANITLQRTLWRAQSSRLPPDNEGFTLNGTEEAALVVSKDTPPPPHTHTHTHTHTLHKLSTVVKRGLRLTQDWERRERGGGRTERGGRGVVRDEQPPAAAAPTADVAGILA